MYKTAFRLARVCLVWTVIVLMAVDSGLACGLLARLRGQRNARSSKAAHCCTSVAKEGAEQKDLSWGDESPIQKELPPDMDEAAPMLDESQAETPAEQQAMPEQAEPPVERQPAVETPPAVEAPTPAEAQPAEPATLPPAAEMQPEQPAPVEPQPPVETQPEPAVQMPAVPAEPAIETPPAVPAEQEMPPVQVEPPVVPAEPAPAAPPAKDALDDLFGADPAKPAAQPAAETPAPAAPAAKDALDDLFGAPAPAPAPAKPAAAPTTDPLDDLFGDPAPKPAAAPAAPAEKSKPAAKPAPANDDPFSRLEVPQPESLALRHWTDNTGNFSVYARLVQVLDGKVKLQKETGRTCTVEIQRLSTDDVLYLQSVAQTMHSEDQLAAN